MDKLLDYYLILKTIKEYDNFYEYCLNKNIPKIRLKNFVTLHEEDKIFIFFRQLPQSTVIYPVSERIEVGRIYRSLQTFPWNKLKEITLEEFRYV